MKFTFGIITNGGGFIENIMNSIAMQIPSENYEIIIIGKCNIETKKDINFTIIEFDETKKNMWITRKKNLVTEHAKYDNIVFLHDYICLEPNWYQGFLDFVDIWDVCITPIKNLDNTRFRDLTIFPFYEDLPHGNDCHLSHFTKKDLFRQVPGMNKLECLMPYNSSKEMFDYLNEWQYISGAYWVAKKHVMKKYPLNETLVWLQGEDLEWSERIKKEYNISFNINSEVKLLKQKDVIFVPFSSNTINLLKINQNVKN